MISAVSTKAILRPTSFAQTLCSLCNATGFGAQATAATKAAAPAVLRTVSNLRWASSTAISYSEETIEAAIKEKTSSDPSVSIKKTSDRGWGLYATQDIPQGERIFRGRAVETSESKDTHSVQIDWDKHVTMGLPAILINHSCLANVGIQENDLGAYDFFALDPIAKDSELLWDYETAEFELQNFECSCGAPNCRGILKGFQAHGDVVLQIYGKEHIAKYLLAGNR